MRGNNRWVTPFVLCLQLLLQPGKPIAAQQPSEDPVKPRSVYLDTSFEAEQALARVEQLEADEQWIEAASRLQQVTRDLGRHVIADGPDRYVSVSEAVGRRIAGWPEEGLAVYRAAFEPTAQEALSAARRDGDLAALLGVADEYFATRSGAEALVLAVKIAMEREQFVTARRWLEKLRAHHPDRDTQDGLWRAKSEVCSARLGDPKKPLQVVPDDATPSVFCGAGHRRARFSCDATPEAVLWKFAITDSREDPADVSERHSRELVHEDAFIRAVQTGRLLSVMPVEGDGLIFTQDGRTVWAVDPREPSRAVWTYEAAPRTSEAALWMHDESVPSFYTLFYAGTSSPPRGDTTGGRLYAHLEVTDRDADVDDDKDAGAALVCLDAETGHVIWKNNLKELATAFEEPSLDGAPILHDGKLYAVGRRRKSFGFEACFLLRLDAEDGRLLDMIHVGEAATGSYGYRRATLGHPAVNAERVFVQSNLGSIAAVRTIDGRLMWIHTYESLLDQDGDPTWPDRLGRPIRSWHYQPVICWRDAIICLPLDANDLLILGQDDGRLIRKIAGDSLESPETILGVDGDLLYCVGSYVVCYDLAADRVMWKRPVEMGRLLGRGALTDHGVFIPTDRALLHYPLDGGRAQAMNWPINQAGHVLPLADQLVIAAPKLLYGLVARDEAFTRLTQRMADSPDDPWIALTLAELAFVTGDYQRGLDAVEEAVRRLGGFARMSDTDARRRLYTRLTAFSESLLAGHRASTPDTRDVNAEELTPDPHELPETTVAAEDAAKTPRDTQGVTPLHPQKATLRAVDAAVALLRMAGQCAVSPEEQVAQRFRLARVLVLADEVAAAVETYQQVLSDPGLRRVVLRDKGPFEFLAPDELAAMSDGADTLTFTWDETPWKSADKSPDGLIAGRFAASRIDLLIRRYGPSVYSAVDQKARDRLTIARGLTEPSAALEVAESFPNSSAATKALAVHARRMNSAGDRQAASRSYRRALRDRRHADRPKLIKEYVDCLIANERFADASDWLARAARDYPDFVIAHEEGRFRFPDYRERLLGPRTYVSPAHAVALTPVTMQYDRLFPDRVTVLEPLQPDLTETKWDDVLTVSGGQLDCRNPLTGRSRWPRPFATPAQPVLLGMDDSRYYFATATRIFSLTRTSGQLAWQYGEEPPDNPMVEPEHVPSWAHHVIHDGRLYSTSDRGRLICLSLSDGELRWSAEAGAALAAPHAVNARFVCYAVAKGVELHVGVLDAHDGRRISTIRPADSWPLQSLLLTRGDRMLLIRSTTIHCLTVTDGESRWRVTTPGHFYLATLHTDADALYVSTDARRITAYDLEDGSTLWRSRALGPRADQGIWAQLAGGSLYVACADRLHCLDAADGRIVWEAPAVGCLKVQAPRLTVDSVVTISPVEPPRVASHLVGDDEKQEDPPTKETGTRYRIHRYALTSGAEQPLTDGGLLTAPIASFGGLYLRNHAILLLDGQRMLGHISQNQD